jgi:hypothetical protein
MKALTTSELSHFRLLAGLLATAGANVVKAKEAHNASLYGRPDLVREAEAAYVDATQAMLSFCMELKGQGQ